MAGKKKIVKTILIALLIILLALQFFRPEKNIYDEIPPTDIAKIENIPGDVSNILVESCYDCHSNNTVYPWYNDIAPVNLFLDNHVKDGKRHLNFSEWANYSAEKKEHKVEEIGETVEEGEMPLDSYLWLHAEAKLTDAEEAALLDWVANYSAN
ncbi:heme-binding domain-containing protein [Zunongwangia sp. H14]|uniref:heme-binding domain-containing protein n=1 Tax=Zunongwangia sp. H14 TaxID=3240792 RepID=UPI003565F27F